MYKHVAQRVITSNIQPRLRMLLLTALYFSFVLNHRTLRQFYPRKFSKNKRCLYMQFHDKVDTGDVITVAAGFLRQGKPLPGSGFSATLLTKTTNQV